MDGMILKMNHEGVGAALLPLMTKIEEGEKGGCGYSYYWRVVAKDGDCADAVCD